MGGAMGRGVERGGPRERLFGKDFVLLCLMSLASFAGFQFLLPTLPLYMQDLDAQDTEIGLILGIYSVSALIARVLAGRALDLWGRERPLVIGALLYLIAMLLCSFTTTVPSVLLLRLFHGVGFGMVTTACSALATDLAPPRRRGEALGYRGDPELRGPLPVHGEHPERAGLLLCLRDRHDRLPTRRRGAR